jgi:hypothetical protein
MKLAILGDSAAIGNLGDGAKQAGVYARSKLIGNLTRLGVALLIDNFACSVLASTAATCDWKIGLDFAQRLSAALDDFADLAIADGSAHADVHTNKHLVRTSLA